jgi:hypothetical protein
MLAADGLCVVQEWQERLRRGESFYPRKGIASEGRRRWHCRVGFVMVMAVGKVWPCTECPSPSYLSNICIVFASTWPASLPDPEIPSRLDPQSRVTSLTKPGDGKHRLQSLPGLVIGPNKPHDDGGEHST